MSDEKRRNAKVLGWVYHKKHPILKMEYATKITDYGPDHPEMTTADKVHYTSQEKDIFDNGGGSILVHEVKKQFNGILVAVDQR